MLISGKVECWGWNDNGQLGNSSTDTCDSPSLGNSYSCSLTPVTASNISNAVAVAAGSAHTCAVLSEGSVKCWGGNNSGQLGDGTTTDSQAPVTVSNISSAVAVTAGDLHTCAVLSGGSIQCWGLSNYGQVGNGTITNSSGTVTVSDISNAVAVSAGPAHTCAVFRGWLGSVLGVQ